MTISKPLANHPLAPKAAEAAQCAKDQGKFWEMHSLLMFKNNDLDKLSSFAADLGLDIPTYEMCLRTNRHAEKIARDMTWTDKLGINGVPAFIFAEKDTNDATKYVGISALLGALPFDIFRKAIDQTLEQLSER